MEKMKLEVRKKKLIEVDGLKFKDLNGNGKLDPYEDWRLPYEERIKDLVGQMNLDEKVGMMMICTQEMGQSTSPENRSQDGILNNEYRAEKSSIFANQKEYGNTRTVEELKMRHFILRENYSEKEIAEWINAMNELAEGSRLGIPVIIASNSRNENAERTFGMNDAVGVFSTWPSTLGLAAAAMGDLAAGKDASIFSEFAETANEEWKATGIRKGYMYMVDTATDPRWMRIYGTFGERTDLICEAAKRLLLGFQGEKLGKESTSLTMKHFPSGGPRENGFDPHYAEGKLNVYATEGSLEKYHLPPFQVCVDYGSTSIMPYYSIPSSKKSAPQTYKGQTLDFEDVGFAFNKAFLKDMLRDDMGFKGYVNSDSGILDKMCWGMENSSQVDRAAKAINAGTDIIADTNEVFLIKQAVEEGKISIDRIDEAVSRLLHEMFTLGLFDDKTYVDPDKAVEVIQNPESRKKAYAAHLKSVVPLKNKDCFPWKKGSKVYVEAFHKEAEKAVTYYEEAVELLKSRDDLTYVDKAEDADIVWALLYPKTGNYFTATPGLLELTLCENKTNVALDGEEYKETTLEKVSRLKELSEIAHAHGGKFVVSINTIMPWILDNVEPLTDGLVAHFETLIEAQLDVFTGKAKPSGKLPLTLPASEKVIAVDENYECVSPNDVPGYDKQKYMPKDLHYAYVDEAGNEYISGFGLTF